MGVPAAIRPMTGTAIGRPASSSTEGGRTLPRLPSMTLGVKPRDRAPMPWLTNSGSLITSIARARLGMRRINPRSSSAVMSRWIPDLDRRSSASFISSNDGGTPLSFSRSWMKRRSSNCLRVNIARPHVRLPQQHKTNHERTLSVPYVFRNHLISREEVRVCAARPPFRAGYGSPNRRCPGRPRVRKAL